MNTEQKNRYFQELTLNLRQEGFSVGAETEEGHLPVKLDGQRLCFAIDTGGVRYRREDVLGDSRSAALDRVTGVVRTTAEYMGQMETAPQLGVGSEGDYRLLADFNNIVLAGHPTRYGVQFITWERMQQGTALHQGDYYGPCAGVDSYAAAKRDFAVRSGLIPKSALFTPEQLMEIHHCSTEALAGTYPITDQRQERLQSIIEQIERSVPGLGERIQKDLEFEAPETPAGGEMQLC